MDANDARRPGKRINRPQGYNKHYITFYRLFDSDEVLRFRIDSEPPADLTDYLDSETHVVVTNLIAGDFFDTTLFHNTQAVARWAKHVGRLVQDAA